MKYDCGETWKERKDRLAQWHRWFAWRPIQLSAHDCRWLEFVERSGQYYATYVDGGWAWRYRAISK